MRHDSSDPGLSRRAVASVGDLPGQSYFLRVLAMMTDGSQHMNQSQLRDSNR
jgi:hypothetical protein